MQCVHVCDTSTCTYTVCIFIYTCTCTYSVCIHSSPIKSNHRIVFEFVNYKLQSSLVHCIDALPTENQIRVCPSIQDRRGWVWTKNIFEHQFWMFDVSFSIFGKHSYGADGMVGLVMYLYI